MKLEDIGLILRVSDDSLSGEFDSVSLVDVTSCPDSFKKEVSMKKGVGMGKGLVNSYMNITKVDANTLVSRDITVPFLTCLVQLYCDKGVSIFSLVGGYAKGDIEERYSIEIKKKMNVNRGI